MDSPLARVILATLGGYLLILLFLSVYDWVLEEYPRRPTEPMKSERIQHQLHHQEAIKALQLFSRLPKHEKTAIKESLKSNLISIKQWLTRLRQSNFQILCMGELHKESTRSFLSKEFFANFSVDVLLLEATPEELKRLIKRMEAGRDYFPLLDADIMNILRTVRDRNPDIKIYGIEQTDNRLRIIMVIRTRVISPSLKTFGAHSNRDCVTLFYSGRYTARTNRIGFSITFATKLLPR